jgi:oligopeptide transport system permease protein
MITYVLKRIGIGLLTIFVLVTLAFFLMKILPGGPFDSERVQDPRVEEIIAQKYNLDKPVHQQYFIYLKELLQGDLGLSFKKAGVSVASLITKLSPITMRLGFVAFGFSVTIGITLGIIAALTKHTWVRTLIVAGATLGISIPGFLLAIFLVYVFAVNLRVLPVIGLSTWRHYVMPTMALSFYPIAFISRMTRSTLTEVLKQDYIVMARSKGLSRRTIILRHALKNALIPIVTYLGPMIAFLMIGSFVIENLFAIPGIGKELVNAIQGRDYPVILGLIIFLGALVITMNLVVDLFLGVVDPRIKVNS